MQWTSQEGTLYLASFISFSLLPSESNNKLIRFQSLNLIKVSHSKNKLVKITVKLAVTSAIAKCKGTFQRLKTKEARI